jgi:hypothetical protein
VLDNVDLDRLGRLLVDVAQVPSAAVSWAWPCAPFAGPLVGFFCLPPIGANVWVEFEGGDPAHPIWSGAFWITGEPPPPAGIPGVTVLKTEAVTLIISDEEGVTLIVGPPAVEDPITITIDQAGVQISVPDTEVLITPQSITLTTPPTEVTLTSETGVSVEAPDLVEITSPEVSVTGNVSVEGAVEVEGDVSVLGAVEINGGTLEVTVGSVEINASDVEIAALAIELNAADVEIAGAAIELTGAGIAMTGLVEVTGDLLIDGQQPIVI